MIRKTLLATFLLTSLCLAKPLTDRTGLFRCEIPDDWGKYKHKGPQEVWYEPKDGTRVWCTLIQGKAGERPLDTTVETFSQQAARLGCEVMKVRKVVASGSAAAVVEVKTKDGWWDVVSLVPGAPGVATITLRYSKRPDAESDKLMERLLESFAWAKQ